MLLAATAFGPDGFAVHRQLAKAADLPIERLLIAADDSWVVWHQQHSWAMAFYSRPQDDVVLLALAAGSSGAVERLLPRLEVPRIFLYAPVYRPDRELKSFPEQAVDTAEKYFHALLELYLDRQLQQPRSWFRQLAEERAAAVMDDVPEDQRLATYADAAGAFAAHLLSIAHEIARAHRRAERRGEDLCALLEPPRTLFALWQRSIDSAIYPGMYNPPADPQGGSPAVATSRRGLASIDKQRILEVLFDDRWTGKPAHDFAHLCPPQTR